MTSAAVRIDRPRAYASTHLAYASTHLADAGTALRTYVPTGHPTAYGSMGA